MRLGELGGEVGIAGDRRLHDLIDDLAKDYFVLASDQRGFAESSKPHGVENYTPDRPVADLIALAEHYRIDHFTLAGHDWGGAIAWLAALNHPERITRLIIVIAPFVFQKTFRRPAPAPFPT
ncbi:alpha/beta fold hydrolase [Nocardia pseudovaccinii]|uniref:alpha/beta fold hydrolase n=1 Tax=Nocardia pseudovaccinii TaxID=189540 RepID=UPI0007A50DFF|nr:alpha/beta fold hydrolase [Nocardia pseudovaccinii]